MRISVWVACAFLVFGARGDFCTGQKTALEEFYNATGGPQWRNNTGWGWDSNSSYSPLPVCDWYGLSCASGRGGVVTFIMLSRNNLIGTLPASLGCLSSLRYLDLSHNHLSREIPLEITFLQNLNILNLAGNLRINGSLPLEIGNMHALQILDISVNEISGEIPETIYECTGLRNFLAPYNQLEGSIPTNFYSLDDLSKIDLSYNLITGNISDDICNLNLKLQSLLLSRNALMGTIPTCIGDFRSLTEVNLQYNQISGDIPEEFCNSKSLERLILAGNFLSGNLPSCFSQETMNLAELDVSRNALSGTISNFNLMKLELLDLSTNGFSGPLPNITNLASIQFIDFSANFFSGSLPETLKEDTPLVYMRSFDASSNLLEGTLPEWISYNNSVSLFLTNNQFLCPYPKKIPLNVHVDTHCVSGIWYEGLFVIFAILLEFFGFITTVVGLTVTLAYLYRPSLLESVTPDSYEEEIDKEKIQSRSDWLLRARNFLLGCCILEIQATVLMFLVGVIMYLNDRSFQLYSIWFLLSIPITSLVFFIKSILLMVFGIRRWQTGLLCSTVISQLAQLIFVVWAFLLEGVAQANALSVCVIGTIILDNLCNGLSIFEAYLIQDQFIPLQLLKLDDTMKIAEGAFGEVRHGTYLGIDIAAKRAKPQSNAERKEVYKAFLKEAKILSELGHHSNIVKLIGVSPMLENEFYIVMEYCEGGTALQYLKKVREVKSEDEFFRAIVKLCMGVCDAMHYFHSKGYTHRDITTSNIMVKRGKAMLGDMGLARRIKKTRTSGNFNTSPASKFVPRYNTLFAAPELANGCRYTKQCDVYCFGVAIWEMTLLKKWSLSDLQKGTSSCLRELFGAQPILSNIVSRCWHEEPGFRPSFAELLEEFSRLNHTDWSSYRSINCSL